jgi:hypothetical protein
VCGLAPDLVGRRNSRTKQVACLAVSMELVGDLDEQRTLTQYALGRTMVRSHRPSLEGSRFRRLSPICPEASLGSTSVMRKQPLIAQPRSRTSIGRSDLRTNALLIIASAILSGCTLFSTPKAPSVSGPSLAPPGPLGYVVCPNAVTPVELATGVAEADIALPVKGTPASGNFAIATSLDGHWAYVVTSVGSPATTTPTSAVPVTTGVPATTAAPLATGTGQNVVIPIDLDTQRALRPIEIPGSGGTHGIVVTPDGRTVLAASGSAVVPVDVTNRRVGTPLDLGAGHLIFGMVLNRAGTALYVLVAGGVIPVDTVHATAGAPIATGLSVSSVYSPHGITISADGATVYVVGQGGADYGGHIVPIGTAGGQPQAGVSFDRFGIAAPAAVTMTADGNTLLAVDAANNWVNQVPINTFSYPPVPVKLPPRAGLAGNSGTQHPTDIVLGPDGIHAYVVDGFDSLIPYTPMAQTFGQPIQVCEGASSMAITTAP